MADDSIDSHAPKRKPTEFVELCPERDDLGKRLDRYVADQLPDLSRGTVQALIESGHVRVDGQQRKPKFRMTPGEVVSVEIPPPEIDEILPDPIPLAIVYEDADVIVVDKPAGMVVHPAPGHPRGTLANALLAHVPGISVGGSQRPGIVHRLDKDTSGLIVAAKTDRGRTALVTQWESSLGREDLSCPGCWFGGRRGGDDRRTDRSRSQEPATHGRRAVWPAGCDAFPCCRAISERHAARVLDRDRAHASNSCPSGLHRPSNCRRSSSTGERVLTDPRLERQFLHASALAFQLPDGAAAAARGAFA